MKLRPIITTLIGLLLAANIAWAQDEEFRKHLLHALGGPFIIYRRNLQVELKLSGDQKQKLLTSLPDYLEEPRKLFDRFKDLDSGEGEQEMRALRPMAGKKLWALLKEILRPEQLKRFQQLELQHEGPAALLGGPEIDKQLKITDGQRQQFMGVVREMQMQLEPLMKEAHSGGNGYEIRQRAIKIYADQERKIESILNDVQRKQWLEMYGKPADVFNDD